MIDRKYIKQLVIDNIFDWENTTNWALFDSLYLWLNDVFEDEYFYNNYNWIWVSVIWFDERDIAITFYSEKIGGYDIILNYINRYSIDWITDHIIEALHKIDLL